MGTISDSLKFLDPDRNHRTSDQLTKQEQEYRGSAIACLVVAAIAFLFVLIFASEGHRGFHYWAGGSLIVLGLWVAGIATWHVKPTSAMIALGVAFFLFFLNLML